jgi:hypothetical protein
MEKMVGPRKAASLPLEQRLALGKRLHEKEWPTVQAAAGELGISDATLWSYLAAYRKSIGVVTPGSLAASGRAKVKSATPDEARERKRAADRARKARYREMVHEAKAAGLLNGAGQQLVPVAAPIDVSAWTARIAELETELERAHDEVETLQKLLMVVGRSL